MYIINKWHISKKNSEYLLTTGGDGVDRFLEEYGYKDLNKTYFQSFIGVKRMFVTTFDYPVVPQNNLTNAAGDFEMGWLVFSYEN